MTDNSAPSIDSNDYRHTFYGILNKEGELWTPLSFDSEKAAQSYLEAYAKTNDFLSMIETHKIVPVRVQLTALEQ